MKSKRMSYTKQSKNLAGKKRFRRILPRYKNSADLGELYEPPIRLNLGFDRWYEIPTRQEEDLQDLQGFGGVIDSLIIIHGKNIQADLLYQGKIECRNNEDESFMYFQSYLPENPLFHAENMTIVGDGHYRFTTSYYSTAKTANIDTGIYLLQHEQEILELFCTLRKVFDEVVKAKSKKKRKEDFYDFEKLLREYKETGKLDGDCKTISTFNAGMIEAQGLETRIVAGKIYCRNKKFDEGHLWAEAFVPLNHGSSYWIPIDPALELYGNFPPDTMMYSIETELPVFKDQSVKTARLRLQYV